ncbi:hypothetical protein RB195_003555 [Necator americanus]|uniref:Arylesterase n=1 Tax=Necator americanus TaxID=51031 RepID=A0ABR1DP44_NECAM
MWWSRGAARCHGSLSLLLLCVRSASDTIPAESTYDDGISQRCSSSHRHNTMTYWCWWHFVVLANLVVTSVAADICLSRHFHDVRGNEVDDYIIYGLTQDCQIFFIRPSQIPLLSTINVNVHNSYCYPNLVQLHLKSHKSLLLVTKQAGNRICTLDVQIPPTEMLFGDHLFSYSLLSSLPYASCSHSSPQMFRLEPDLSFLDTVFSDVIYFIDAQSTGALWSVHQFQITTDGFLKHLEKITVNNHAKQVWTGPDLANEYVVALDHQRNYLYVRNRYERSLLFECAYDLLFRPNTLVTHYLNTSLKEGRSWLNSMGADGNTLVYTETDRSVNPSITRLFAVNTADVKPGSCLVYTGYAYDVGIMQQATLKNMEAKPLPLFEKSKRTNLTLTTTSASFFVTKGFRITTRVPKPSTRRLATTSSSTTTTTAPKITTIYSTSTEKIVTSSEFRNDKQETVVEEEEEEEEELEAEENIPPIIESTTAYVLDSTISSEEREEEEKEEERGNRIEPLEKSKILERDHEGIGLMTTLHSEEEPEQDSPTNISSAGDLKNKNPLSKAVYKLNAFSLLYCLFLFILE